MTNDNIKKINIYAQSTDPIYIGTGGYTIGRVDNTIVRDPTTKIPKIPGSSLAGTWRYYVALKLQSYFKEKFKISKNERGKFIENKLKELGKNNFEDLKEEGEKTNIIKELFKIDNKDWILFEGNRYAGIKCAGQDDLPTKNLEEMTNEKTGHCGHCIVCKSFGFSKKDVSWQGLSYFSDLNILLFPVHTRFGVKWITSKRILNDAKINCNNAPNNNDEVLTKNGNEGHINIGWLYLKINNKHNLNDNIIPKIGNIEIKPEDIIIVPDNLISQIINSNLEVRTSVSIDPITGTAKEGALFTSEAIPRGTIFYGNIRIFNKKSFEEIKDKEGKTNKLKPLPTTKQIKQALCDSKIFFETLGIGGMTTRGFGRLKIELIDENENIDICNENKEGGENGE